MGTEVAGEFSTEWDMVDLGNRQLPMDDPPCIIQIRPRQTPEDFLLGVGLQEGETGGGGIKASFCIFCFLVTGLKVNIPKGKSLVPFKDKWIHSDWAHALDGASGNTFIQGCGSEREEAGVKLSQEE